MLDGVPDDAPVTITGADAERLLRVLAICVHQGDRALKQLAFEAERSLDAALTNSGYGRARLRTG